MRRSTNKNYNGFISNARNNITRFTHSGIITNNLNYLGQLDINKWEPPGDWLRLPDLVEGDQRMVGLFAVMKGASGNTGLSADSNFVALLCQGNYIVDWGNGVTSAHTSNTQAQYQYNFENIPNSTLTSDGYKQVIIQVYPQTGQNLTTINLARAYNVSGVTLSADYVSGWLDLKFVGANVSSLFITTNPMVVRHSLLKRYEYVGRSSITTLSLRTWNLEGLEKILGQKFTENVTDFSNLGRGCFSLSYVDLLDTRKATNLGLMFENAASLKTIPPFNFANATVVGSLFRGCANLKYIPQLVFGNFTSASSMFQNCNSLQTIPFFDTKNATDWTQTFQACSALEELPQFDTSSGVTFNNCFDNLLSLNKFPELNFSNAVSFNQAFFRSSISEMPFINAPKSVIFTSAFFENRSLLRVKGITFGPLTAATSLFGDCPRLVEIGPLNVSSVVAGSTAAGAGVFQTAFHLGVSAVISSPLSSLKLIGLQKSVNLANKNLCAANLNDIFENCANVTGTGATIEITNNWGSVQCNRTIATSKGWTVVG
jgi:hypothetical protein